MIKDVIIDLKKRILSIPKKPYALKLEFAGSGLNDFSVGEKFNLLLTNAVFTFKIVATDSGGDTVLITNSYSDKSVQTVITNNNSFAMDGIIYKFGSATGHTVDDVWTLTLSSDPLIKHCAIWNNQLYDEENGKIYDFAKPAVFIEFQGPVQISQLGDKSQQFDGVNLVLHIIDEYYNSIVDSFTLDENIEIFDIKQQVYQAMNGYVPTLSTPLNRVSEDQDFDHSQIYHYKQAYKSGMTDNSANDGIITTLRNIELIISNNGS